jgi:hypothetical protein
VRTRAAKIAVESRLRVVVLFAMIVASVGRSKIKARASD